MQAILIFLMLLPMLIFSQLSDAHTWYVPGQTYIRMEVAEDGIYRATASELSPAGYPGNIPVNQIKVYYRGTEQNIHAEDLNGNSIFDGNDFIEFMGFRNDGGDDARMYKNPETGKYDIQQQPNSWMSLFTDTAVYYFTWNAVQGKRLIPFSQNNYASYTAEPWFTTYTHQNLHLSNWVSGGPNVLHSENSEFVTGEGYYDLFPVQCNAPRTHTVSYPGAVINSPNAWELQVRVFSYSLFSHALNFQFGNIGSFSGNSNGINVKTYIHSGPMQTLTGNQSNLTISSLYFPTDNNYISWIRCIYDRNFNLNGNDSARIIRWSSNINRYLKFTQMNITPADMGIIYDLNTGYRITGTAGNGTLDVIIPGSNSVRDFYVSHSGKIKKPFITSARFRNIHTESGAKYIIITDRSLQISAQQFSAFRQSSSINPQSVIILYTDEIYDEFGYGSLTPLAIRRCIYTALKKWNIKPEYVLLWGKGMSETLRRNTREKFTENKVPSYGFPPSDLIYGAGFDTTQISGIPEISVGRVNIYTNAEGSDYIQKLQQYEQTPWDGTWMKEAVHLGGGENESEQNIIAGYLRDRFENVFENTPLGGNVLWQQKSNSPVTTSTAQQVRDKISAGVGLITFFGHSTSNIFDIEIREPGEYSNYGKYPLILANGCYGGNYSSVNKSFGEKFMLEPGRGCIAYIASSGAGYIIPLGELSKNFYETAFRDSLGVPLGKVHSESIKRFINFGCNTPNTCPITLNHALQTNLQGDPALILHYPVQPDYEINSSSIRFNPDPFSAGDSVQLQIITRNLGRATLDSVPVSVQQEIQSGPLQGQIYTYTSQKYKPILHTDTLLFPLPRRDEKSAGINRYSVWIDSSRILQDINYLNNQIQISRVVPGNAPAILYPPDFALVPAAQISLCASAFTMGIQTQLKYEFEIDTAWTFNSPAFISSGIISGSSCYLEWKLPFTLQENQVYYWRVKLSDEPDAAWANASFRYQQNRNGWVQTEIPQYRNNIFYNLHPDLNTRSWKYDSLNADINIHTNTGGNARFNFNGIKISNNDNQATVLNGIWFSHVGGGNLSVQTSDPLYGGWKWFPMPAEISALKQAIQQVPSGDFVILCSQFNAKIASWNSDPEGNGLYQEIENLGAVKIRQTADAQPYIVCGKKGGTPGSAIEINTSPYQLQTIIQSENSRGSIFSRYIGPFNSWEQVKFSWNPTGMQDTVLYSVFAVNKNGQDSLLNSFDKISAGQYGLSTLPANIYPGLKLSAYTSDQIQRTAPHLDEWEVSGTPVPDIIADATAYFHFDRTPTVEGRTVKVSLQASNYTLQNMDSLKVRYRVITENKNTIELGIRKFPPVPAGNFIRTEFEFSTSGIPGNNTLVIELNPDREQNELYAFNNFFYYPFQVGGDGVNPVLDISFDGRHIMDGEIVSPRPEIVITSKDNNPFYAMDSLGCFRVSYKTFSGRDSVVVLENNAQIQFEPGVLPQNKAKLIYRPGPFSDGEYTLQAQSFDKMGNPSGEYPYQIRFRVINENTISPVFNYPNPFSTRTRFVFTLTGSDIPQTFRIDIFTITGKLVRRIDLRELGFVHIGQNLNGYEWDGTDDYGDRLANGVYLYKVITKYSDGSVPRVRDESGVGSYFKNGFGKLVMFR